MTFDPLDVDNTADRVLDSDISYHLLFDRAINQLLDALVLFNSLDEISLDGSRLKLMDILHHVSFSPRVLTDTDP